MISNINNKDKYGFAFREAILSKYNPLTLLKDNWQEIPINEKIGNSDNYVVEIQSNDIADLAHPIKNIREDNYETYTIFNQINEKNKTVSLEMKFTKKENLCFLMLDIYNNIDDDYYEENTYYSYKVNLYGADTKNNYEKLGSLIPSSYPVMNYDYYNNEENQHSLVLIEENPSITGNENHYNFPKYLLNFNHNKRFIYYKIEFEFVLNMNNYDYNIYPQLKLSRLACFSKNNEMAPLLNFPLSENCNEINNRTQYQKINVDLTNVLNKPCAYFSGISYLSFPETLLSNIEKEITISFFCYVNKSDLVFFNKSDIEKDSSYKYFLSKLESSGWGFSYCAYYENDEEKTQKIRLRLEAYTNNQSLQTIHYDLLVEEFCDLWNHICFVYDGKTIYFYFNKSVKTLSIEGRLCSWQRIYYYNYVYFRGFKMFIGCENNNGSPGNFFKGYLREVVFYKVALMKNKVEQIYSKGI